jgi:tetratricopeptide (TPR) repeat protein
MKTPSSILDAPRPFSQSLLWKLQEHYFTGKGVDAWRQSEVPHYVTSNPTIADAYARIVFAFWSDYQRLKSTEGEEVTPFSLCELGAGSGRFAFQFLQRLLWLSEQEHRVLPAFRYVLTDFTQSNLDFWRQHPAFQPFFARGLLDIALLDIAHLDQITLQLSGQVLTPGSLEHPLVVIANYVWDSIPQDLYYINAQTCQQCFVSLSIDTDPGEISPSDLIANLKLDYEYRPLTRDTYEEPALQDLLDDYQRTLTGTHLLFPAVGLRCLQYLQTVSKQGLLLLSADKGDHRLSALEGVAAPQPVWHGSFSLNVNYHAFKRFCEQQEGVALFPERKHESITIGGLLLVKEATQYRETQCAYQEYVQELGPEDFYRIYKHARRYSADMSVEDILVYLRLSHYDSHQCIHYLPRLLVLAPTLTGSERLALTVTIDHVWQTYFPLREAFDLPYQIANIFYALDDYQRALTYFERSVAIYGPHTGTLYNMAVCHRLLEQHEQAERLLQTVVNFDPENQLARSLLAEYLEIASH